MIFPPEGRLLLRFLLRDRDLEDLMKTRAFVKPTGFCCAFLIAMHAAAVDCDQAFLATYQREHPLIG
jgi:hypothetical protein